MSESIRLYRKAVEDGLPDSPDLARTLNNLGISMITLFRLTGCRDQLAGAIDAFQKSVEITPVRSPDLPGHLVSLGNGLRAQFGLSGDVEALNDAIRAYRQAVEETPAGAIDMPTYLNNLGNGLRLRAERTESETDLEETIRTYRKAVQAMSSDSIEFPGSISNLGICLRLLFGLTGRQEYLDEAVHLLRRAVRMISAESPDFSGYLNNLGIGLISLFGLTKRLDDLEESIDLLQRAVEATSKDSPELPDRLNNLGAALAARFESLGCTKDLEEAIRRYRQACGLGAIVAPQETLNASRNWGRWALRRASWLEVEEAYSHGLAAGRALQRRQLRRSDKESYLGEMQEMAPAAAYAIARAGGSPARAAHTLELGRAQLLGEALQLSRRDLDSLPADLKTAFDRALAERRRLEQPDVAVQGSRLAAIEAADRAFDAVVAAIRQVDGFADFLADPTIDQISYAAQSGPLVYLLATAAGGLALIVHGQKPSFSEKLGFSVDPVEAVWLDELTEAKVREWLAGPPDDPALGGWLGAYQDWLNQRTPAAHAHWLTTMDGVLRQVWDMAMGPLVAALAQAGIARGAPVTLIPSGLLALLPLHAAWTADVAALPAAWRATTPSVTDRIYALDCFALAYVPSATALGHAQAVANQKPSFSEKLGFSADTLLAVDEPQPVRAGPLPNSAAEVAAIGDLFSSPTVLRHAAATRSAALAALPAAQVAHFSCHGGTDWDDALASGLLMANDEMLTVGDLLDKRLPGARLATLSACETGIVGAKLPDESVALPAALLQAGFAGVAASLWAVADMSTAMLMVRFYELWREEGLAPPAALCAAQRWVRDTTNDEKANHFQRHFEPAGIKLAATVAADFLSAALMAGAGDERSFAHPSWWAAFYYTGV